ncbi:hypothetical protein [Thermomonospora umbrina]|uniref:hypothetical protein n=1 Tax=Thermomonospora umbrina TaxID=111806 RepID=UPI000E21D872|nr:hypothetical protein [Thermomonospora umbrina]
MSLFREPVWVLQPAHADDHYVVNSLHWERFPDPLVMVFKTFALAALDHPYPPVLALTRRSQRMAVDTLSLRVRDLRVFAQRMADHDLADLAAVTARHLDLYQAHVLAMTITAPRKASLLGAVRILWGYRDVLPAPCRLPEAAPWGGASGNALANVTVRGGGTKTPRIAAATMESLLGWSLRMLEDFGPDIADAWHEYSRLNTGTHPSQERFHGLKAAARLKLFLAEAAKNGTALPGHPAGADDEPAVNGSHLGRMLGLPHNLSDAQLRRASLSGLPIARDCYIGVVRGRIDGRPWRDQPITVAEIQNLVRLLTAACFVIVSYLSGLRPG